MTVLQAAGLVCFLQLLRAEPDQSTILVFEVDELLAWALVEAASLVPAAFTDLGLNAIRVEDVIVVLGAEPGACCPLRCAPLAPKRHHGLPRDGPIHQATAAPPPVCRVGSRTTLSLQAPRRNSAR